MRPIQITFVDEAPGPSADAAGVGTYSRFIDELGIHAGTVVAVTPGLLRNVFPKDGFIIQAGGDLRVSLSECPAERRGDLASRLIPLHAWSARVFKDLLEPLSLAAAIDGMAMQEWESEDASVIGTRGLYGRRDIGQRVGASCLLFESERYCYLQSTTHRGLPHLLADYLRALQDANDRVGPA